MTRPKVPDEKRQRTAQACDICKRRKQKCNGKKPCTSCLKKSLSCEYTTAPPSNSSGIDTPRSPTKRRLCHDSAPTLGSARAPESQLDHRHVFTAPFPPPFQPASTPAPTTDDAVEATSVNGGSHKDGQPLPPPELDTRFRRPPGSEPDEEPELTWQTRMLQDPRGRLLYLGDSATLTYLQLIRLIVSVADGSSPFTQDPSRHMIMEATVQDSINTPHVLPDRDTAVVLVESYFVNTGGILEVLDRHEFEKSLEICYSRPLAMCHQDLCLIYMTMAIGLVMATPAPNTREHVIINRLRSESFNRSDVFYKAAKALGDPVTGFEDSDLWSVQALILMSVYMLAVSKRNAAYAYYGMAERLAFALGLHRISEFPTIFPERQVTLRRNIWRSMFILDRFLSASLGRPTAIAEEDCSESSLTMPELDVDGNSHGVESSMVAHSLDAAIKSCQSIGHILRKVYSKRKVSVRLAQDISKDFEKQTGNHPDLDPKRLLDNIITRPAHVIAALHVHLFRSHSVILLNRPFLLYLMTTKDVKEKRRASRPYSRAASRIEKHAEACLAHSIQTIKLVRAAYRSGCLPQRNPFTLYFLFAAVLIILSNEFSGLYNNPEYEVLVDHSMVIIEYCSRTDVQAERLLYIVKAFSEVVSRRLAQNASEGGEPHRITMSERNPADPLGSVHPRPQNHVDRRNGQNTSPSLHRCDVATCAPTCQHSHSTAPMPRTSSPIGPRGSGMKAESTISTSSSRHSSHSTGDHSSAYTTGDVKREAMDTRSLEDEVMFESFWNFEFNSDPKSSEPRRMPESRPAPRLPQPPPPPPPQQLPRMTQASPVVPGYGHFGASFVGTEHHCRPDCREHTATGAAYPTVPTGATLPPFNPSRF